jgi:hypothetical protein
MGKSSGLSLKTVLLLNGLVNILAAFLLIGLPALGIGLPGLKTMSKAEVFLAGGWGVAVAAFALARLWAWRKPDARTMMGVVGLFEGLALTAWCVVALVTGKATVLQALLPLLIGLAFAVLYALALTIWRKEKAPVAPAPPADVAAPPPNPESYLPPA